MRRLLPLCVALFLATGAQAQQASPPDQAAPPEPAVTRNGDWFVACTEIAVDGQPQRVCEMQQTLEQTDTGQAFIRITIGYPREAKQPTLRILAPLGVMLQQGMQMQIDGGQKIRLPFQVCLSKPPACMVQGTMEDDIIAAMKRGKGGTLTVVLIGNQTVDAPFSLNGFTASFDAIK